MQINRNDPYRHNAINMPPLPPSTNPKSGLPIPTKYNNISRGTTVKIPVTVKTSSGAAMDLSRSEIYFTLKPKMSDMLYDDRTALIKKTFVPQDPLNGSFYIILTPQDTWLIPDFYYFDIVLQKGGNAVRLGIFVTQIVEGVTNRNIIAAIEDTTTATILDEIGITEGVGDNIIVMNTFTEKNSTLDDVPAEQGSYTRTRAADGSLCWTKVVTHDDITTTTDYMLRLLPTTYSVSEKRATVTTSTIAAAGMNLTYYRACLSNKQFPRICVYSNNRLLQTSVSFNTNGDIQLGFSEELDYSDINIMFYLPKQAYLSNKIYHFSPNYNNSLHTLTIERTMLLTMGVNMQAYDTSISNKLYPNIDFYYGNNLLQGTIIFNNDSIVMTGVPDIAGSDFGAVLRVNF